MTERSTSTMQPIAAPPAKKKKGYFKPFLAGLVAASMISTSSVAVAALWYPDAMFWSWYIPGILLTLYGRANISSSTLVSRIITMESSIVQAIDAQTRVDARNKAERSTVTDAQIANSTAAQIQAEGALATWKQGQDVTRDLAELRERLLQPLITCLTLTGGVEMPRAGDVANAAAAAGAKGDRTTMFKVAEPARSKAHNYTVVMEAFCSKADKDRGRCIKVTNPLVADDNVRAGLLFGDEQGALTRDTKQEQAVQAVIERLAGVRNVPPPLPNPASEKTASGKVYVETQRDYAAMSQLASSSLQRIRMNHRAQAGVGDSLKSAGIASDQIPSDLSMSDAVRTYIDAVLSPSSLHDMAGATDPLPILRQMVQTDSFDLWLQFQQLQASQRMAALQAAALTLEAEKTLRARADRLEAVARDQSGS